MMESQRLTSTASEEVDINRSTEPWVQLPAEDDRSQFTEQISVNPLEGQPPQSMTMTTDWEVQQFGDRSCSLQLDFQDSRLSPALSLLPSNSGKPHNFSEYSLFQQTDLEFAPLRGSPDISVASERFIIQPQGRSAVQPPDYASLSQHPLAHTTTLSDDGASSCCSLSQHSMSPGDGVGKAEEEKANNGNKTPHLGLGMGGREEDDQTLTYLPDKPPGVLPADDASFLSGGIPAHKLLELLQKDVGIPSGSSSAVSSASETSLKRTSSFGESKSGNVSKPEIGQATGKRECPQGGASVPPQKTEKLKAKQSLRMSEISNITIRTHSTQPDDTTETLYRQLCAEIESSRNSEPGPEPHREPHTSPVPDSQTATPDIFHASEGKVSATRAVLTGVCGTGPRFSAGVSVERGHRERDLWSSGNLTGIDGSFLGFLPQPVSQSTPGIFHAPVRSSAKPTLGRLSAIESNLEASQRSRSRNSSQPAVVTMPDIDATDPDSPQPVIETLHESSGKVRSLPSLNYLQKVDAWRANQSLSKTSLFDNLALQGFSGVSPKQKAFDAISDSLNRMLTPQGSDNAQLQLPVSGGNNQVPQQNLTLSPSGLSSPTRGEAVGSAPHEKDDAGAGGGPPASPLGRSQSYSSLSTVVTSIQPVQQAQKHVEQESSRTQERSAPAHCMETERGADRAELGNRPSQSTTVQPSPLVSLGRFSDVSSTQDMSGILSQDSYHSGQNFGASMGASSVVSLEVDNYAPYWNSKPLSPPKGRELNIEDRIPMYLHNLGIDQSPSTILTPFAPRGPIREPEFSPTDICTITTGTPTKSTQPSEGDSPPKGEFSRSSLLSVGSSMSIPLSVDSLHPIMPFPEQTKGSPSPDRAPSQGSPLALCPLNTSVDRTEPQDTHQPPAAEAAEQQQKDSSVSTQEAMELAERFDSSADSLRSTGARERDRAPEPCSVQSNEDSFVGSKTLQDIRRLLGRAENIVSGGSSLGSSSGGSQLHSDDDVLFSLRRKMEGFQDSSFTSSSAADPRSHSSLLWARSSSDSMLTSDRLRESSAFKSSREPGHQSAQALSVAHTKEDYMRPQGNTAGQSAGSGLLAKSVRRAEPEGCSAGPSDTTGPVQPSVMQVNVPSLAGGGKLQQAPAEAAGNTGGDPAESRSSSCTPIDSEQFCAVSDVSSESSLAARVAQLLQSESPATVVSSRPSTADLEESRAREWIKMKVSGQQCEPLELNVEDRQRIEEIKRELLLHTKHPVKSQGSTDTESSAVSSLGYPGEQPPSHPVEQQFSALRAAEDRLSHQLQQLSRNPFDSSVQLRTPLRLDLEARVREIALREGLALPTAHPPPLTSITITTCRCSPSPVPPLSPTPEPLLVAQLATNGVTQPIVQGQLPQTQERDIPTSTQGTSRGPASVSESEPNSSLYTRDPNPDTVDSQSEPGVQPRQEVSGTHYDLPHHGSLESIEREDVRNTQAQWRNYQLDLNTDLRKEDRFTNGHPGGSLPLTPSRYRQISRSYPDVGSPWPIVGHGADPVSDSSTLSPPTKTQGHISHIHLTLSPKGPQDKAERATDQALYAHSSSRHAVAGTGMQSREFAPLRHSSVTSSVDECLGYAPEPARSNQARSHETQEPVRRQRPGTADASVQFSTRVPEGKMTCKFPQSFTPPQRLNGPSRPLAVHTPALPVLLPYKPHGSEELFYIPQTDAQLSPIRSDTTMESSHPGSDDAVPPRFNKEILGSRDQEVDRGVTIKHTEGIYSKRLSGASFSMKTEQRGTNVSVDASSQISDRRPPHSYSQSRGSITRVPLPNNREPAGPMRDQGTTTQEVPDSPVQPSFSSSLGEEHEDFQPLRVEVDYSMVDQHPSTHPAHSSVPHADVEREQGRQGPVPPKPTSHPSDSSLDQLWRRFSERWFLENARPTNERDASLLERLERLSRLIHGTEVSEPENAAEQRPQAAEQEPRGRREGRRKSTKEDERRRRGEDGERSRKEKEVSGRRGGAKASGPRQAWVREAHTPIGEPLIAEEDSPVSLSSNTSQHLCPAERDESGTGSGETSTSMSTVDTARLIRAFGAHRVRSLKTGTSLNKLYSAIDKQREEKEQRRGKGKAKDPPHSVPAETTGTDDSTVTADSASSSSTYTVPSHRGPSQSFTGKKAVKLVSRGIQAGDLEIVVNGTRRHTRDVGTTFPSPGSARGSGLVSASSSSSGERRRRMERSPPKAQGFLRERKSKRSTPKKHYPQGVTWYVPADDLKAMARKENQMEAVSQPKPSQAWFEAYCGNRPWREPFRQRHVQIQEERETPTERLQTNTNVITELEPEPSVKAPAALVRMTLQESLELRRPDFVSQSRERIKRMALQVEERKLQAVFSRERDDLFNRPEGLGRLPRPAGTAPFKRAVPRKEMVQRSKQRSGQRTDCVSERVDRRARLRSIYEQLPEVQKRREEERRKAEYGSYRLSAQVFNKKVVNRILGRRTPWQ